MIPDATRLSPSRPAAWRAWLLLGGLLLAFAGLTARAVWLQALNNDFLRQKGDARHSRVVEMSAHRGMITDRQGAPLAVSTPVESVWASPADFEPEAGQLRSLSAILGLPKDEILRRTADTGREFAYLKRHLPPDEAARVVALNVPGVFLQREYRRYYPDGEVVSHLVGFTGIDDTGQEGIELAHNDELTGKPGSRRVIKDRLGRIVEDVASIRAPRAGRDIALSIDRRVQYLAWRELRQAVEANRAKGGGIVVLDATTGEVLALANLPAFNPNQRTRNPGARTRNRALTDSFEPGSTLKPFTAAAALESGTVRPDTVLQTAPGSLTIGSATIRDVHPQGALTVAQIIQKSSNVGAAKMALALPSEQLWTVLHGSGFGSAPGSGFPGEVGGKLRPAKSWRPIEQATMSYGHGLSVTLLQLARAYTVFATEGRLMPVSLLRADQAPVGERVLAPETARAVRAMLEMVVRPGGTAPKAQVTGYRIAGKTGTAHKLVGGHYAPDRYVASFVGFAPASAPRLVVAVVIDEPGAGQHYGGAVAAPVFSAVMAGALRTLGVKTDAPIDNVVMPSAGEPEVREEV